MSSFSSDDASSDTSIEDEIGDLVAIGTKEEEEAMNALPSIAMPQSPSLGPAAPFEVLAAAPNSPALGVINTTISPAVMSPTITSAAIEQKLAANNVSAEARDDDFDCDDHDDRAPDERRSLLKHKKITRKRNQKAKKVAHKIRFMLIIAFLGAFLTGYNTCVLGGALPPLSRRFDLSNGQEELIVCTAILFAFLASLSGGIVNTKLGRRKSLLLVALLFGAGDILLMTATRFSMLLLGQVLVGAAIGIESMTNSLYVAEIAPPAMRGAVIGMYSLTVCGGQFGAGLVAGICGPARWRHMFGFCLLPVVGLYLGTAAAVLPESPAWCVATNKVEEAKRILMELRVTKHEVLEELKELMQLIHHTTAVASANYSRGSSSSNRNSKLDAILALFSHGATRRALLLGSGLMIVQQLCGVNTVVYYSATIFESAGFSEGLALWLSATTSLAQSVGLCLSVVFVESAGRRVLVLLSLGLSGVALTGLGLSFYLSRILSDPVVYADAACMTQPAWLWDGITTYGYDCVLIEGCGLVNGNCVEGDVHGPFDPAYSNGEGRWHYTSCDNPCGSMSVFFMVSFLVVFGLGMGGLPRTIAVEIFIPSHRNLAVSIVTAFNWISNLLISVSFLTISSPAVLTQYGAFGFYALVAFAGVAWLSFALPETKGLSISEVESLFSGEKERQVRVLDHNDKQLVLPEIESPKSVIQTHDEQLTSRV